MLNRNNTIFLVLISLLSFQIVNSQIRIVNYGDGKPIGHVAVYNLSHSSSTFSNDSGYVDLKRFCSKDTLIFQHPSFNLVTLPYEVIKKEHILALSKKNILLEEFIISASKRPEKISNLPYHIDIISQKDIQFSTAATSAELLEKSGDVLVQKSQGGGGSPILRGFEANKILLVVDGIRMNNAIYRNGHLQNSITIDNEILEKAEVIFGPTSIMYGSDALGGVISYHTKDPEYSMSNRLKMDVNAKYQYGTINSGETKHLHLNLGLKKIALLASVTDKNFGDIVMGANRNPFLKDFGKQFDYVTRQNNHDTIVKNSNPLRQRYTGYNQRDYLLKLNLRPHIHHNLLFNVQYSTSSDIPRYENLNDTNHTGAYEYAEWYYGPQDRYLASLHYKYLNPNILFTEMSAIISHQVINESRIKRKYQDIMKRYQQEHVDVYSFNMDFYKRFNNDLKVYYGFFYSNNIVDSRAWETNIRTNEKLPYQTRYPDGESYTNNIDFYTNIKKNINDKLLIAAGGRYGYYDLEMNFTEQFLQLPFSNVRNSGHSLTGSLSLIYFIKPSWDINLIASSGFRNPNIDDLGKIRVRNKNILIPNNKVKPEYAYNLEFGTDYTVESLVKIGGNVYGTFLKDAIVRSDFHYDGSDSILYDGEFYNVQTNLNSDKAIVYGLNVYMKSDFSDLIQMKSTLNYTKGTDLSGNVPLGHIPPVFGMSSIKTNIYNFVGEFYAYYNGWKHIKNFSPEDDDKPEEATQYGYPAWGTLNVRVSYILKNYIKLQFSVENILDQYYKPYASAISGPGRNFIMSVSVNL